MQEQAQQMQIENNSNFASQHQQNPAGQQQGEGAIQFQQLDEQQYQEYAKGIQQNSKRLINKAISDKGVNQPQEEEEQIQPVKNPVSAYMCFTMKWKNDNPDKKFSMSNLGELWKNLEPHEKRQFEEEYRRKKEKFDLYVASKMIKNPEGDKDVDIGDNKFFFPLHRIKAIMKQDKFYAPKTQAVTAMARATEYFGEYFLEELKRITEGKNRIDTKDLFECINVNQKPFGFLQCLIEDYKLETKQKKSLKMSNDPQMHKDRQQNQDNTIQRSQKKKAQKPSNSVSNTKPLQKGQIKLTDMFAGLKQN